MVKNHVTNVNLTTALNSVPVPHAYCPKMDVTFSSMTPPHDVAQLCVNGHHLYPESHMGATTSMVNSPGSRGTNSMWEMLKMLSK